MRILIINYEYPPLGGGGGVATRDLAEQLALRHQVVVLTSRYGGLPARETVNGVRIQRVRTIGRRDLPTATIISLLTFAPAAFMAGWRLCRSLSFDVINAQFVVPSGLPAALLARFFRIPFVLSFIGGDLFDPTKGVSPHRHWILRATIRWIARAANVCTAISNDTKRNAQEIHGVQKEIIVTPIGLVPSIVSPAPRRSLGLPDNVPLFVSIGRLIPRKGYEVLLDAWREIPTAHLVIIGEGPLRAKLENLRRSRELAERVRLLGFVDEPKKGQILRAADAYVSASEHEGFGIVFLEAMEAGLPIIATDRGGHTDFLNQGQNAILVPPGDRQQLAAAVQWLLRDSRLREQMARTNKEKAKEFYLEKTVAKFERVLLGVIAKESDANTAN